MLSVLFVFLFYAADGQVWGKYGYIDDNSVIRYMIFKWQFTYLMYLWLFNICMPYQYFLLSNAKFEIKTRYTIL